MCPNPPVCRPALQLAERGFSLVAAIFLLVILSALGVFMLSISTMQQTTSTQDLQGSKAYQAAKAGIEWGAYKILTPENSISPSPIIAPYVCPAPATIPALGGALLGFTVTVGCTSVASYTESGNTVRVYQLTSLASFGTAPATNYVERSMTAVINTCRLGIVAGGAPC
jgi:MSHA biogenesis protein MshP